MTSVKKQGGFAELLLIGMLLSFTIFALVTFENLQRKNHEYSRATEAGLHLQQYTFGVMKYISEYGQSSPVGTFTGADWLKPNTCPNGTSARAFISDCTYIGKNTYGDEYQTVVTLDGNVARAQITVNWPVNLLKLDEDEADGVLKDAAIASIIRSTGASFLSGSTPVSQTFAKYTLDKVNKKIVVDLSTAPSTDIWFRTDGSNKMNANANINGNALYGVSAIYGAATAVDDKASSVKVGSALNVVGILTVGSDTDSDTYLEVKGVDGLGRSIITRGLTQTNGLVSVGTANRIAADLEGDLIIRNNAHHGGTSAIRFFGSAGSDIAYLLANASGVTLNTGINGDFTVTNSTADATVVADKVYDKNINRYMSQGVYNITMAKHADYIQKPTCPYGQVPQIFASMAGVSQNPSRPIRSFEVYAIDAGMSWQVLVDLMTDGPATTPAAYLESSIVAMVKCS